MKIETTFRDTTLHIEMEEWAGRGSITQDEIERLVLVIVQEHARLPGFIVPAVFLRVDFNGIEAISMPREEWLRVYGPRLARDIESAAVGFVMACQLPVEGRDFVRVKP